MSRDTRAPDKAMLLAYVKSTLGWHDSQVANSTAQEIWDVMLLEEQESFYDYQYSPSLELEEEEEEEQEATQVVTNTHLVTFKRSSDGHEYTTVMTTSSEQELTERATHMMSRLGGSHTFKVELMATSNEPTSTTTPPEPSNDTPEGTLVKCVHCSESYDSDDIIEQAGDTYCTDCHDELFSNCDRCGNCCDSDDVSGVDDEYWCSDCIENHTYTCQSCSSVHTIDHHDWIDTHDGMICESCGNDYSCCDHCGEYWQSDDVSCCGSCDSYSCPNCSCECGDGGSYDERSASGFHDGICSPDTFDMPRLCGVEIEVERGDDKQSLADSIPRECGICDDGSLDSSGVEIQTPPASGSELARIVEGVCKATRDNGYMATRSCGLHIHLDGRHDLRRETGEVNGYHVSHLLRTYYAIEPLLFAMLPSSRQDNHYCKSIRREYPYNVLKTCNPEKLSRLWYHTDDKDSSDNRKQCRYDNTRYCGLNLHSLWYRGSVEIRYHSGSTDYAKIRNWIRLNQAIFEYAIKQFKSKDVEVLATSRAIDEQEIYKLLNLPLDLCEYIDERIAHFKSR